MTDRQLLCHTHSTFSLQTWANFLDKFSLQKVVEIVETIPHRQYIMTFNKWLERMRLCLGNKDDYFEHLKIKHTINDA